MTESVIRCDHCRRPIAPDQQHKRYRIRVECVPMQPTGPVMSALLVSPPVVGQDFCDLMCLTSHLAEDPNGH